MTASVAINSFHNNGSSFKCPCCEKELSTNDPDCLSVLIEHLSTSKCTKVINKTKLECPFCKKPYKKSRV